MTNAQLNYQQWLSFIEACHSQEIEMGLERITEVGNRANILNFKIPVVTVAGTNGKGSTVASLSKLLMNAGLNVGTYTSPHLFDFKERIQINGKVLSEEKYCKAFSVIESFRNEIPLTFFEFTTLTAFAIFQDYPLDIIVLEVGLGGAKDAVNVIDPSLAIVTSIGFDHQSYLGNTLESIATEKAGIFRPNIPVLLGRSAKISTLLAKANRLNMELLIEDEQFTYDEVGGGWSFGSMTNFKIKHYLPPTSVSLAMAAYTILGRDHFSLPALGQVVKCLQNNVMIGRLYPVILNNTPVVFDVGHNAQGGEWLAKNLKKLSLDGKKVLAVWASMSDKDLAGIVKPMKEIVQSWFIGPIPDNARCATLDALNNALVEQDMKDIHCFNNIVDAFNEALLKAQEQFLVVFGSFYAVSHIMQHTMAGIEFSQNGLIAFEANHLRTHTSVISEH